MDTLARVQKIIAEQMERPLNEVEPDTRLEDLGDSLDLIEVVYALEVEFKVDIYFPKEEVFRPLAQVSPVVEALSRTRFDDSVKRVRLFAPRDLARRLSEHSGFPALVEKAAMA